MAPHLRLVSEGASSDVESDAERLDEDAPADPPLTADQQKLVDSGLLLLAPCAASVARGFHYLGITPAELLGPGAIGLREAAVAFDPGRHTTFPTYAKYHVRGRMVEAIKAEHFSLRARMERAMDRSSAFFESHQVTADPSPDAEDGVARDTRRGLDDALAASMIAGVRAMEQESPEEVAVARISIRKGMATLSPLEREVIRLGFEEGMTLDEVADETGVHANTAQRRQASAVRKLRAFVVGSEDEETDRG